MIRSKSNRRFQIFAYCVLSVVAVIVLVPFVLLFVSSFTDENVLITYGYSFFPRKLSLESYAYIFKHADTIFRAYSVTILVTVIGTAVNTLLTVLLAYPLSLRGLPGKRALTFYVFFTMLFNGGLVPTYMLYANYLNIKNTIWALIVPGFLLSAMNVLLMRTYMVTSIPSALYEAASIDGASQFTVFAKIVLPLSKPIMVTLGIFSALGYWNDWTNALYYITDKNMYSIQSLLNKMLTDMQVLNSGTFAGVGTAEAASIPSTGVRMAIALVAMLPLIVTFPFLQKYFQKGIALGAVKG